MFDYLIVGAGFAGSVLAERLARGLNKRVLIVDKRAHIGGNAYDCYDAAGILIHRFGPHILHTNSADIFNYLFRFTEWRQYQHRVLACVDGRLVPIPINLDTINTLYGTRLDAEGMRTFLAKVAENRSPVVNSEDVVVNGVGRELYEKFFRGAMVTCAFNHPLHSRPIVMVRRSFNLAPADSLAHGANIQQFQGPVIRIERIQVTGDIEKIHAILKRIQMIRTFEASHPKRFERACCVGGFVAGILGDLLNADVCVLLTRQLGNHKNPSPIIEMRLGSN